MRLFNRIFKTTTLTKIKNSFSFLENEFGFQLLKVEKNENYRANNFLVYLNEKSKIQIEICADENWFHSVIRRVINGKPANYKDTPNCISFEDLAVLESGNNYNHFDYYPGGEIGLEGVLENTSDLFKRNSTILTTDNWIDIQKTEDLKQEKFEREFGKFPDKRKPTFFSKIKEASTSFLLTQGYYLSLDSNFVSPFDKDSITNKLIFENGSSLITISQKDWRDDYFIYQLTKNEKKVFEIDISKINGEKAIDLIMEKIKANK